uniref:Uncharacterized protein n=1 Tax=Ditylenchus dipsaci TaxID=166011 RepID=A0A915DC14_9BILA
MVLNGYWSMSGCGSQKVFMLEKEVDILSQIRHRNIIQFFGVSHANPDFYIVTEYAENGSLYSHLHNDTAQFSSERLLKWATQIAHGVQYLHYEAPVTIIHRDLKSKNVVIGNKMTCKLSPTWGGTAAWMSPEIISQKEGITTATDVWSFGVLLWEMITREIPYKGLTEFKIYSIISQQGVKLVVPAEVPAHLANLLKECWHANPKERIKMREVVSCLEAMKGDKELQQECAHFVEKKDEWVNIIQEQLQELDELKLDLARRMEELNQREQALRRRENSHSRNFWQMMEYVPGLSNVMDWDEICVVEWEIVDKIIALVLQYEIKGSRLLQVTEKDLERLGVENVPVRRHLVSKIEELRSRSDDNFNFPSLEFSKTIEARDRQDKTKLPFNYPIILHVGMYSRVIVDEDGQERYRFKVFLDSDWRETKPTDSVPPEVHDSATVIKDVCITMTSADQTVLLELSVVYVHLLVTWNGWMPRPNACLHAAEEHQNKCTNHRLTNPKTLCSKEVISSSLFNNNVEKTSSTTSLQGVWKSRRRSFGVNCSVSPERLRKSSLFLKPQSTWSDIAASLRKPSSSLAPTSNPPLAQHSKSIGLPVDGDALIKKLTAPYQDIPDAPIHIYTLTFAAHTAKPRFSQKLAFANQFANKRGFTTKIPTSKRWRTKSETDFELPPPASTKEEEKHRASFFVDPDSPSLLPPPSHQKETTPPMCFPNLRQISPESDITDDEADALASKFDSIMAVKEPPNRCCANNCRSRKKILPPKDEEIVENLRIVNNLPTTSSSTSLVAGDKKPRRRKSKKQNDAGNKLKQVQEDVAIVPVGKSLSTNNLPQKDTLQINAAQINGGDQKTLLKACSQQVHGGYNKWRWKT